MKCVEDTLQTFGFDTKHGVIAKIGEILLLQTWTQQMTYHPHIHCIIPTRRLDKNGCWNHSKSKCNFLFHVRVMSRLFKSKLLAAIHYEYKQENLNLSPHAADYKYIKNKLTKKNS